MGFVYEELTDNRKKDYPELEGKYPKGWYIDKDRNICIWGGLAAGHWMPIAEGDYRWKFHLGINHEWFEFILEPGEGSVNFNEIPFVIKWDKVIGIKYINLGSNSVDIKFLLDNLKDALRAWGGGYIKNSKYHPNFIVEFNF